MNSQSGASGRCRVMRRWSCSAARRRGPMRTLLARLPFGVVVPSPWPSSLALDADDAVVGVDVQPGQRQRFRYASAGANEQVARAAGSAWCWRPGSGRSHRAAGSRVHCGLRAAAGPPYTDCGRSSPRRVASASADESAARALLMVFGASEPASRLSIIAAIQSRMSCSLSAASGRWARWGRRRLVPCAWRSSIVPSVR